MGLNYILTLFFVALVDYVVAESKCCPPGQVLLMRKDVCWEPKSNVTEPIPLKCKVTIRFIKNYYLNDKDQLKLHLGEDLDDETVDANSYCLGNYTTIKDVNLTKTKAVAIVCADEEEEIIDDRILGYTMIISIIFLVMTIFVYSLLPELRDVQGKSIINFCISLAIGLGILVIMKLMTYYDMGWCATRGFLAYFFLIAAFFWSNAISIQVLINTRRPAISMDHGWKHFKFYMLYAWGCPIVLTACMAIVNFYPGKHQKPGIGLNHCWFFNKHQQWYYMYSIMFLLLVINFCIFVYTSFLIWRIPVSSSIKRAVKYKLGMTVQLIVLMGLPWVFEMISSLAPKHIIWTILDIINTLQGILIFLLLVVFRKRVVKVMYQHGWLDCISNFVEKYLATKDDEENVVQHTDVPMNDRTVL
ncbi:hypothetical protein SFRURICE_006798 [Spodoptera frugiperda]|nr:hypothetical protein SFRURICE_006798 [Spodoptera frugiperda]